MPLIELFMWTLQLDVDTAAGKLARYQELRKYLLLKSRTDARERCLAIKTVR